VFSLWVDVGWVGGTRGRRGGREGERKGVTERGCGREKNKEREIQYRLGKMEWKGGTVWWRMNLDEK